MLKSRIYTIEELSNKKVQDDIKTTFQQGGNVVFPTETVYGIGGSALSEKGINGIYAIKGRPNDNPLIMHFSNKEDIKEYVDVKQEYVTELINAFWPGPMTLVFDKKDIVPDYFTGGLQTVGVRIPGSDVARKVIEIAEVPVCAPSANISGRPSSTLFKHVVEDFNNKVDILIDGGKSEVGLESTVIDVTKEIPVILRPGMITVDMVKSIVGNVYINSDLIGDETPKAPGMKYKHYAPKAIMTIIEGNNQDVVKYINQKVKEHENNNEVVGIILTNEVADKIDTAHKYIIGNAEDELTIASNLFAALREMDSLNVDYIYSLSFEKGLYSEAIMNRLRKAANNNIKKV